MPVQPGLRRVLLVGGGPAHLVVLRAFARRTRSRMALTLVAPARAECYSGMVPGIVAGRRDASEASIALPRLAAAAGASFIEDRVVAFDPGERTARLSRHPPIAFDFLSLNLGAADAPAAWTTGATGLVVPLKPLDAFLERWQAIKDGIEAGRIRSLAVVGAGAAGVEIVLAIAAWRDRRTRGPALALHLIDRSSDVAPSHAPRVRRALADALACHDVRVWLGARVCTVDGGTVLLESRQPVSADAVLLALPGRAPALLARSGLACNRDGEVEVDASLRSRSHPFVVAAGDCAVLPVPHQHSGAVSVRQGPVLAHNLTALVEERPGALQLFRPRAHYLALIGSGDDRAVLSYGRLAAAGGWVHSLKQRIDQRWVAGMRSVGTA